MTVNLRTAPREGFLHATASRDLQRMIIDNETVFFPSYSTRFWLCLPSLLNQNFPWKKSWKKNPATRKCYMLKAAPPSSPMSIIAQLVLISITSVHMQLKSRLRGTWQHLSSQACHSQDFLAFWPQLQHRSRSQKYLILFDSSHNDVKKHKFVQIRWKLN